jgi:nucleotide sugar dehydrogenase
MLAEISKLKLGLDFHLAFSPERVSSGSILQNFSRYPKLVGGIDQESESKAGAFYSSIFDFEERPELKTQNGVWMMGSSEAAELAKLAETTYRDVNIALANQFAIYAETIGVNIYSIIQACNSQPFSHIHEPGVSVGGHCIPVYPHLYLMGDPGATIVSAARAATDPQAT